MIILWTLFVMTTVYAGLGVIVVIDEYKNGHLREAAADITKIAALVVLDAITAQMIWG